MADPKILPPSLRQHKRYVVFEVVSEYPINYGDTVKAIWSSMTSFLGELGGSDANLWFIHNLYDEKSQRGVVRCRHDFVEEIRLVLSLVQVVGETRAVIKILGVTGTIKSAKTKYLNIKNLRDYGD